LLAVAIPCATPKVHSPTAAGCGEGYGEGELSRAGEFEVLLAGEEEFFLLEVLDGVEGVRLAEGRGTSGKRVALLSCVPWQCERSLSLVRGGRDAVQE
jgi:hypothetical protein